MLPNSSIHLFVAQESPPQKKTQDVAQFHQIYLFVAQESPPHSLSCSLDNHRLILPVGHRASLIRSGSSPSLLLFILFFLLSLILSSRFFCIFLRFHLLKEAAHTPQHNSELNATNNSTQLSQSTQPILDCWYCMPNIHFIFISISAHLCVVCRLILDCSLLVRLPPLAGPEKFWFNYFILWMIDDHKLNIIKQGRHRVI